MASIIKRSIGRIFNLLGYNLVKRSGDEIIFPIDMEDSVRDIIRSVKPFTMTSIERIYGLIKSVDYITSNEIEGDIVECGVWQGGSMMSVAQRLCQKKSVKRGLWLYDTFEGMPAPTSLDYSKRSGDARSKFNKTTTDGEFSDWCNADIATVRHNLGTTSYPEDKIKYIKGKVEDTIPGNLPEKIALLRLDTDWYESTKHELIHLYPLLVFGGVIIIDDYGHWEGCRTAVDEFMETLEKPPLLNRLDYTGRIGVKLG
ncbi:MAG: TylF/MycF family methyltransferase [Proteobacteria bacterium]|nr:TylF/MycF family methyltransferase [Pseudomonadota bacterium]MBU1389499.1 TylF/MycF family methyltransferase [Pseudomonadota bacterium]MBU1541319.1 TylF/MycF family methyltransferase [Pseudomonadota bacterium]MBU2429160.1 TylF/MycF family methyltransferase [Pseudomonadota bacterium]MBU2481733.1 TylF/MycF family methyltransferase [Pseudomonadota bacterium]